MSKTTVWIAAVIATLLVPAPGTAQETRRDYDGSAVVREVGGDSEALIRILCDEASRPEAGFITEPNRTTRSETGRSNSASLRLRPWKDTGDVLITSSWGSAWIPAPTSSGGVLAMEVEVRSGAMMRNGQPVALTYDMWKAGDVPPDRTVVEFEANCNARDPEAPAWRLLPEPAGR